MVQRSAKQIPRRQRKKLKKQRAAYIPKVPPSARNAEGFICQSRIEGGPSLEKWLEALDNMKRKFL